MGKINPDEFKIDPKKATRDDIAEAMKLLEKQRFTKARVAAGELKGSASWADMPEEQKATARARDKFVRVETKLYKEKAIAAGITVTREEVDAAIAAM